jgi:23S rRNA (guanine745-N1)-methyltransferase
VVTLVCPVRGCGAPLARLAGGLGCPRGHRFDLARSGYCNLLQPQDRRSRQPGDSAAAVAARRRLFDRGHGDWLVPHLLDAIDALRLPPGAAGRDVGGGAGVYLGAHGLDLSAAAVELAARRYPQATWVVANADRFLPYAAGAFSLALSLTARLNAAAMRRVLAATSQEPGGGGGGFLLVAVPGADDLVELRAAVLGEGQLRDRLRPAIAALAADFEVLHQAAARDRLHLQPEDLRDLLAATYRGGRHSERRRGDALSDLEVTVSRDIAVLRPWPPPP